MERALQCEPRPSDPRKSAILSLQAAGGSAIPRHRAGRPR